jgi:hypothetical protein
VRLALLKSAPEKKKREINRMRVMKKKLPEPPKRNVSQSQVLPSANCLHYMFGNNPGI